MGCRSAGSSADGLQRNCLQTVRFVGTQRSRGDRSSGLRGPVTDACEQVGDDEGAVAMPANDQVARRLSGMAQDFLSNKANRTFTSFATVAVSFQSP
jgi:hypothetical protein